MKLLFITPQLPYPPLQGTTLRNYNLIRNLAEHHTVDLLSFLTDQDLMGSSNPLERLCRRICVVPQPKRGYLSRIADSFLSPLPDMGIRLESAAMHAQIDSWLAEPLLCDWDIVQFEGIEVAQYARKIAAGCIKSRSDASLPATKLLFDDHNCEYLLQKRNAINDLAVPRRLPASIYSLLQWQKLRRYERQICQWADHVLAVSDADRDALLRLAPEATITVVRNGYDPAPQPLSKDAARCLSPAQSACDSPLILFVGKMDYRPNVDAMLWFGSSIFPLIQRQFPHVRLQIVGMNPHPRLDRLRRNSGIEIVGKVLDLEPLLAQAAVYIIPLRVGGGTRFKALEAMAHELPVVTTSLGIEGIPAKDGRELLIRDTARDFSQAVVDLLRDRQLNEGKTGKQLGKHARRLVVEQFGWQSIVQQLECVYLQLRPGA